MRIAVRHMDMTEGVPWKRVLLFSLPIILGNVLQEFYVLTDSLIVSRFIGLNALAAIGGTNTVRSMFSRICMDCSMAFGIVVANRVGAGNREDLKKAVAASAKFGIALSATLMILMLPSLDACLHFLKIADNIYADARLYLLVSVLQIPFSVVYNISCALLRAVGDSRTPFFSIVFSSVSNLLCDFLFVAAFHWGVAGAALATILSQMVSAAITFFSVFRKEPFRTQKHHWAHDRPIQVETTKLWIPMFANSICISVGMVLAHRPINASGALVAAGIEVGGQVYVVLEAAEKAIANGIGVFVGQNMGARQYARIRTGMRHMTVINFMMAAAMCAILLIFGDNLILIFMSSDQTAEEMAVAFHAARIFLNCLAGGAFLMFPMHFFRAAIQAMGHTVFPMIGAFMQAIARWCTVTYLARVWGLVGLCMADNSAALVTLPLVVFPYFYYLKKLEADKKIQAIQ